MRTVAGGHVRDADGAVTVEDDAGDASIGAQVKVALLVHHAMNVRGRGVGATSGIAVDVLRPDLGRVRRLTV